MTIDAVPHDKPDQLQKVLGLIEGERVFAVYDCTGAGTGFVGVTNFRVILQEAGYGHSLAWSAIPSLVMFWPERGVPACS